LSVTGRWFYPGTPVPSTNKNDRHDIVEIVLKVALNTINLNLYFTTLRYSRAFAQFSDFLYRAQEATKLLKQGYVAPMLKSSLQKGLQWSSQSS
jgi:hypothetical protein